MPYPDAAALTEFLQGIPGFCPPDAFDPQRAMATAIREFESSTGWDPFIKDATEKTHFYDPPRLGSFGCMLDLRRGLLETTSIVIGCEPDGSGGRVAVNSEDFVYAPYDGGLSGQPYTELEFLRVPYGGRRSIKIVGRFGCVSDCPEDVAFALLSRAAAIALPIAGGPAGSMRRVKQGPVEYEYDTTAGRDTRSLFLAEFASAVNNWRGPWL